MLLIVIVERWINFVLVTLLCGFVSGSQMILSPAILTNRFGSKNTAIAFGYENFICGIITIFLRPMIIGLFSSLSREKFYYYFSYLLSQVSKMFMVITIV